MRKKGSITVALSLIMLTVLALLFALLESARVEASRAGAMARADLGLFGFLGEYDTDLLDDYGLFFVDGGYGSSSLQAGEMKERIMKYAENAVSATDYVHLSLQEVRLTGMVLAGDNAGEAFVNEAVADLLVRMPGMVLGEISDKLADASSNVEAGEDYKEESGSLSDQIENIRDEMIEQEIAETDEKNAEAAADGLEVTYEPDLEQYEFENPIDTLHTLFSMGILALVAPGIEVSDRSITTGTVYSKRSASSGWGNVEIAPDSALLTATVSRSLILDEYYLDRLGYFGKDNNSCEGLQYQCEYVICGNDSDQENFAGVLGRILLMRFGLNVTHILLDSSKMKEISAVAGSICTVVGFPQLTELLKAAIVFLWAYEEAAADVYNLCLGKKVAFYKTKETFHTNAADLFLFFPRAYADDDPGGLTYKDYLRILMGIHSLDQKAARGMDMVEHEIRISHDRPDFCIDLGVYAVKSEFDYSVLPMFSICGWSGADYTAECSWSYNSW